MWNSLPPKQNHILTNRDRRQIVTAKSVAGPSADNLFWLDRKLADRRLPNEYLGSKASANTAYICAIRRAGGPNPLTRTILSLRIAEVILG